MVFKIRNEDGLEDAEFCRLVRRTPTLMYLVSTPMRNRKQSHPNLCRYFVLAPFLVDDSLADLSGLKHPLPVVSLLVALGDLSCLIVGQVDRCPSFPICVLIEMSLPHLVCCLLRHLPQLPLFK